MSLSPTMDDAASPSYLCAVAPVPQTQSAPSLSAPFAALGSGWAAAESQLAEARSLLDAHYAEHLPPHLNPAALLARLSAVSAALPARAARAAALAEARRPVDEEVQRLLQANRELLEDMSARVGALQSDAAVASFSSPVAAAKSRPQTAPLSPLTIPTAAASTAPTRRKSVRPGTALSSAAPPSPSVSQSHEAMLQELVEEGPISEREFAAVSSTVKSRVKLADVNNMFAVIQSHFARLILSAPGGSRATKATVDPATLPPLTLSALAEVGGAGKIGGATSQCIIGTLRACKRILVDRRGILLVKLPPPYSASAAAASALATK